MTDIPDNLKFLHAQEQQLQNKALELVAGNTDLTDHVAVLEMAMDLIHFFISDKLGETDDDRAIQYLGIRVFDSLGAAWRLMSTGYFQAAAMIQRDIVETVYLVNFFKKNPGLVALWRTADERTRRTQFSPSAVRKALDAAMGKGPSKRSAIYAKFSKLATHATVEGFEMLKPRGVDGAALGPFMDAGCCVRFSRSMPNWRCRQAWRSICSCTSKLCLPGGSPIA